ncbi:aspartyl-tRNA synthetase [Saccharopolyspora phatthalungensis]|uniref:Aspartyl-tRNA synthetase n=2 Tax=Saccharopolyspora phatthalungensis TaxID=664693 RepID=A0A840Q653_9PSEU|nr:aspartyl-tRNA synthetase [Saccharopolyspora phatthalungensis]
MQAFAIETTPLAWIRVDDNGKLTAPVAKFLTEDDAQQLVSETTGEPGTAVFFGAGDEEDVAKVMSKVRVEAAKRADLFEENAYRFCWIVDFPMYEKVRTARSTSATAPSRCRRVVWRHRPKTHSTSSVAIQHRLQRRRAVVRRDQKSQPRRHVRKRSGLPAIPRRGLTGSSAA